VYAFAGVLYWIVTANRPLEAAARVREDTLSPAIKAGDRNRYRPELLAAIDWGLAPHEDDRPKSVHEFRSALAGTMEPKFKAAEPAPPPPPPAAPAPVHFDAKFLDQVERELAQHVGPIAPVMVKKAVKKAQDPGELVKLLAADITHNGLRIKFERRFADASRPVSRSQPASVAPSGAPSSGPPLSPEILSRVETQLAQYLGPVAKVVVSRAARKARDVSELYFLVADEIEDPVEKKAFIRRRISVSSKV
jgi:hypothetical protein